MTTSDITLMLVWTQLGEASLQGTSLTAFDLSRLIRLPVDQIHPALSDMIEYGSIVADKGRFRLTDQQLKLISPPPELVVESDAPWLEDCFEED
jgi:hypothetical protein